MLLVAALAMSCPAGASRVLVLRSIGARCSHSVVLRSSELVLVHTAHGMAAEATVDAEHVAVISSEARPGKGRDPDVCCAVGDEVCCADATLKQWCQQISMCQHFFQVSDVVVDTARARLAHTQVRVRNNIVTPFGEI